MPVKHKVEVIDKGFAAYLKRNRALKNKFVGVGLYGSGGTPETDVASRGAVHQLGSSDGRIPRRPFMSQSFDKKAKILYVFGTGLYKEITSGKMSVNTGLSKLGELHVNQIKLGIVNGNFKPLSAYTIAKKKSTKPLIDTSVMMNSVKYKIMTIRGFKK